jgi:16S rRNA (uracil1498-N3)-methyltransferase
MERRRIYTPDWTVLEESGRVLCRGPAVERMRRVLRLKPGDALEAIPGDGWLYRVRVVAFPSNQQAVLQVEARVRPPTEPVRPVYLGVGFLKHDRLDEVLRQATELGVTHFVPLITLRTVVQPKPERWSHRYRRWLHLAAEALESSGRTRLPVIFEPMTPTAFLEKVPPDAVVLWLVEPRHERPGLPLWLYLREHPAEPAGGWALVIGPEGGWDPSELDAVREDSRIVWTHLGPRTLRTPTGALAALALLMERTVPSEA